MARPSERTRAERLGTSQPLRAVRAAHARAVHRVALRFVDRHPRPAAAALDWTVREAKHSVETEGLAVTIRKSPRAIARRTRAAATRGVQQARTSRARELLTYSRRMVAERGPLATLDRGRSLRAAPAGRAAGETARHTPSPSGVRPAPSLRREARRGGTLNLGTPVVRHHVVHGLNRGRARVNGTIAAMRAKVPPRGRPILILEAIGGGNRPLLPRVRGSGRRRLQGVRHAESSSSATTMRSRFSHVISFAGSRRTLNSRNDCSSESYASRRPTRGSRRCRGST